MARRKDPDKIIADGESFKVAFIDAYLANGNNLVEAWVSAGGDRNGAEKKVKEYLIRNPDIKERFARLKLKLQETPGHTKNDAISNLELYIEEARLLGNYAAVAKLMEIKLELEGHLIRNKMDVSLKVPFSVKIHGIDEPRDVTNTPLIETPRKDDENGRE